MRKIIFNVALISVFILLLTTAVLAQDASEADVGRTLDEIAAALGKNDTATLERLFADDLTQVNPWGKLLTKSERLAEIKSGALKYDSFTVKDRKIRVHGDMAIVVMQISFKAQKDKKDISGDYRTTAALMKMKDGWQMIAAQTTKIDAP